MPLLDGGCLFDPEDVRFLLRRFVPVPTGDFQDLAAWRQLTVQTAVALVGELHRQSAGPVRLVVPMTLTWLPIAVRSSTSWNAAALACTSCS